MTEPLLIFIVGSIVGVMIGGLLGAMYGYDRGRRDTEQRWSEAVSRANYDREMASLERRA